MRRGLRSLVMRLRGSHGLSASAHYAAYRRAQKRLKDWRPLEAAPTRDAIVATVIQRTAPKTLDHGLLAFRSHSGLLTALTPIRRSGNAPNAVRQGVCGPGTDAFPGSITCKNRASNGTWGKNFRGVLGFSPSVQRGRVASNEGEAPDELRVHVRSTVLAPGCLHQWPQSRLAYLE